MVENLFNKEYDLFAEKLKNLLSLSFDSPLFSQKDQSVEEVYHSLLLSELNKDIFGVQYSLLPELKTGEGSADILFVDNDKKNHFD